MSTTEQQPGSKRKSVFLVRLAYRPTSTDDPNWNLTENEVWRLLGKDLAKWGIFVESVEEQK